MGDDGAVDKMVWFLDIVLVSADRRSAMTVDMLRRKSALDRRTIPEALHIRRLYFRRLREKPVLTADNVSSQKAFAAAFECKAENSWLNFKDAHIDVKQLPLYLNGRARGHVAREGVRGSCRAPGHQGKA